MDYFWAWVITGVALVFLVIYLSLTSHPVQLPFIDYGDKLGHLLAYATLTGWFGQLYPRLVTQFWIFILFCSMGVLMEFIQGMGDTRVFEVADMLANTLGAALGWWLTRTWFVGTFLRIERLLLKH